jgi:hypothetical protein
MRFELTTLTLARLCSTPELRPHSVERDVQKHAEGCKGQIVADAKNLPLRHCRARRHPAARASLSVQNHRSPARVSMTVWS